MRDLTAFAGLGSAPIVSVQPGNTVYYAVSGTFEGTWILEYSTDGSSYTQETTGTGVASSSVVNSGAADKLYRFRCSVYTSGTMYCAMSEPERAPSAASGIGIDAAGAGLPGNVPANVQAYIDYLAYASGANALATGISPTRLIAIGDSMDRYSDAYGASSAANMFMAKLIALYGISAVEASIAGCNHLRYINASNSQLAMANTDLVVGTLMFNTLRQLGPNPTYWRDLRAQIEATLSWLSIPESLKTRTITAGTTTKNAAVVTTGTWAYFNLDALDLVSLAMRGDGTATFPDVTGDSVYVWYARSILKEKFTITIDSVDYVVGGPVSYDAYVNNPGGNWQIDVLRITGLTNGAHTVVVSAAPDGVATILGVAGFVAATVRTSCAAVAVGTCLPAIDGVAAHGYATPATYLANDTLSQALGTAVITVGASPYTYTATQDGFISSSGGTVSALDISRDGTNFVATGVTAGMIPVNTGDKVKWTHTGAATATFFPTSPAGLRGHAGLAAYNNEVLAKAVANLRMDGLRVALVDVSQDIITSDVGGTAPSDISTDYMHPSNTGHRKIYQRYKRVLDPLFS